MLEVAAITLAVARGDREAFARLYEAKFDRVYGVARRATGLDESACLDVVQEAFMRVIRKMKPLETEQALDAWLARTTRRAAYDMLRAQRRRRAREAGVAVPERASGDAGLAGAEPAAHAERLAWLRKELGTLDRASADALDLRLRAGLTLGAAGRILGLKPGAVDGRVTRAVARLQERAKEEFDG